MELPEALAAAGLTARPLIQSDAQAVFEVMCHQEKHDLGTVEIELADIVADWQRPSFDVSDSTIGVFDARELIAYGEVSGGQRGDAAVHPAYRGRGVGTFLAGWMQEAGRRHGYSSLRMPVPEGSPGDLLLAELGYYLAWSSWVLELPDGVEIEDRALPAGYALRIGTPEDDEAAWKVLEDAFLEWSVRERDSLEDFVAHTRERPGFEPWNLRVVTDGSGEIVAALIVLMTSDGREPEGYVDKVAVRRDQRGQGIAQALLADAFRAAREHGAVKSGLSTDSRTGALSLYEKVGMKVSSIWVNRAIDL